jgi:hypothetical protein
MTNRQFLDGSHGGNKLSRNRMWLLKWKFQDVTVHLPKDIAIEYKDEHSIDHLIDCVFRDLGKNAHSTHYMRDWMRLMQE